MKLMVIKKNVMHLMQCNSISQVEIPQKAVDNIRRKLLTRWLKHCHTVGLRVPSQHHDYIKWKERLGEDNVGSDEAHKALQIYKPVISEKFIKVLLLLLICKLSGDCGRYQSTSKTEKMQIDAALNFPNFFKNAAKVALFDRI